MGGRWRKSIQIHPDISRKEQRMGYGEMFLAGLGLCVESGDGNSIYLRQGVTLQKLECQEKTVNDKSHRPLNF